MNGRINQFGEMSNMAHHQPQVLAVNSQPPPKLHKVIALNKIYCADIHALVSGTTPSHLSKSSDYQASTDTVASASQQARMEEADTFRGVHLDPNAHHWDEVCRLLSFCLNFDSDKKKRWKKMTTIF